MNIHFVPQSDTLYEAAIKLRYELFFKPHNLAESIVIDRFENLSTHLCISENNRLSAYGRLTEVSLGHFQISQMVVSPEFQRQGLGSKLLLYLVNIAQNKKFHQSQHTQSKHAVSLYLNARLSALSFYQQHNFVPVGEVFKSKSTGVEHIKMVYNLIK